MSSYSVWHYSLDALPSVEQEQDGNVLLRLIIGTWGTAAEATNQAVSGEAAFGGASHRVDAARIPAEKYARFDGGPPSKPGERVPRTYVLTRRFTWNTYFEATIHVPSGTEVTYTITAEPGDGG